MPETTQDFAPVARPSILDRLGKAAADPGLARAWAYARLFPGRRVARNIALSRRAGLRKPCFVLSFDCDTDLDSAVAPALHARLRAFGLSPLYAVAGEVLDAAQRPIGTSPGMVRYSSITGFAATPLTTSPPAP